MAYSITQDLYVWMHKRRIVSAVAAEMGIKDVTLSAELRPSTTNAKLGSDELIPLFNAIRRIGYGSELEGVLHTFLSELRGDSQDLRQTSEDLRRSRGRAGKESEYALECAERLPSMSDPKALAQISTMLQTELLPVVLHMHKIVQTRLKAVQEVSTSTLEQFLPDTPNPSPAI